MIYVRDLQLVQLQMLEEINRICKKHDIKYALFAGSALGAIRHGGFIPWDDDLDIVMMRSEYDRFMKVAPDEIKSDYYVQREFSDHWPMQFSKLRKNNTAFIERFIPKMRGMHMGVYVDIFPCDNLSDNELIAKLQFYFSKIVIAKALDRRGYLTNSIVKKLFMKAVKILPRKPVHEWCIKRKLRDSKRVHVFFGASSSYAHSVFPREWMESTVEKQFEDGKFPVSVYYDELLTVLYGNYMTPTPPNERNIKVHAEIVDLHDSYEKYADTQKHMKFTGQTRSIR